MALTKPTIYTLAVDYARFGLAKWQADILLAKCYPGRRKGAIQGEALELVYHIQDGTTRGSLLHWLGVQASANYMVQRDGSILIVIPEDDGPWTNGDVCNPQLDQVGDILNLSWDPNPFCITIEAEGTPWDSLTAAQLNAIEWLTRDIMRRRPKITLKRIDRHRAFNTCSRWNCPGADDSNDYFLAMQKRLAGGTTTPYANPTTYPWLTDQEELDKGIDRMIGRVHVRACRREWTVKTQTPRLKAASMTDDPSGMVGPYLLPGQSFIGEFVFKNRAGWWVLTRWGTRIWMDDLAEPHIGVMKG